MFYSSKSFQLYKNEIHYIPHISFQLLIYIFSFHVIPRLEQFIIIYFSDRNFWQDLVFIDLFVNQNLFLHIFWVFQSRNRFLVSFIRKVFVILRTVKHYMYNSIFYSSKFAHYVFMPILFFYQPVDHDHLESCVDMNS